MMYIRASHLALAVVTLLASLDLTSATLTQRDLSSSLKSCLANSGATITYPNSGSTYNKLAKAENTNYVGNQAPHPLAIAAPSSSSQAAAVVKCVAAQNGKVKFSPRGGGHGYAAYSLSGQVVMDSSKMTNVSIDKQAKRAKAQFGNTLGPFAATLAQQGFALPHGTCPQVGIAGHSLGGGWGYTSRKWGWLLDHIVEVEFVDQAGNIKTLNAQSQGADADLWWALRGAGSNNFGLVTQFTFSLQDAPSTMTNYVKTYKTNKDCRNVLLALQEALSSDEGVPPELAGELLMYGQNSGDGDSACSLSGMYFGDQDAFKAAYKAIGSRYTKLGTSIASQTVTQFSSYVDALTNIMGDLHQPKVYEPYYAQSIMDDGAPNYTQQSAKAITDAVQAAVGVEGSGNSISFDFNGKGSATNAASQTGPMSFNHRNSMFFSQIYSYDFPGFSDANARANALQKISAITQAVKNAKPNGDWHAYQNYIDPELKNFGPAYYGDALSKLKSIKATADPNTIFDFPQGLAHA